MNKKRSSRGVALIIVVSVLVVLATMAIAFARISVQESWAARNYSLKVEARLVAFAGIDNAMARLFDHLSKHAYINTNQTDDPTLREPWYYPHDPSYPLFNASQEPPEGSETTSVSYEATALGQPQFGIYCSGLLQGPQDSAARPYALKVIDTSGQINLNSHIVMPRPTALADQQISNRTINRIIYNLAVACSFNVADATLIANTLVDVNWNPITLATDPLPRRWTSKDGVALALQALLTATPPVLTSANAETNLKRLYNNVCVSSWVNRTTSALTADLDAVAMPNYILEARAPVNINTASREVLTALVWNLTAQPVYLDNSTVSHGNFGGSTTFKEDTSISNAPNRRVLVLFQHATDVTAARNFANAIIAQRETVGPFRSWGDIEAFIDTYALPFPTNSWAANYNGSDPADATLGTTVWQRTCRDILKANFNPNTIDNRFNPNRYARYRTVKSDFFDTVSGVWQRTHTTELQTLAGGTFDISSIGYVIRRVDDEIVAIDYLRAELSLLEILTHTTQADFENTATYTPSFSGSTTYPSLAGKNMVNYINDAFTGYVEPHINISGTPGLTTYSSNGNLDSARGTAVGLPASNSRRFTTFPGGGLLSMQIANGMRDPLNNLVNDGVLSQRAQYDNEPATRFHSIPALDNGSEGTRRGVNYNNRGYGDHIPYYQGGLEFWCKLTEPSTAPQACGFMSSTQVNRHPASGDPDPYPSLSDWLADEFRTSSIENSEGVQFYLFKNTFGQIRLSRLYFCVAYNNAGNAFIGTHYNKDVDGWNYAVDPPSAAGWTRPLHFAIPRREVFLQPGAWEAGTWHRIFVRWDDSNLSNSFQVWIDNNPQSPVEQQMFDGSPNPGLWPQQTLLNEKGPMDCLNICGFFRPVRHDAQGLLQFTTDTNRIFFPANATIANVRIYQPGAGNPTSGSIFPLSGVTYQHTFRMPTNGGVLGTISWIGYPRRTLGGGAPHVEVSATAYHNGGTLTVSSGALTIDDDGFDGGGLSLQRARVTSGHRVEYTVSFSATSQDCSSLDSINVTVLRPELIGVWEYVENETIW